MTMKLGIQNIIGDFWIGVKVGRAIVNGTLPSLPFLDLQRNSQKSRQRQLGLRMVSRMC
jgi:hypothetical protein